MEPFFALYPLETARFFKTNIKLGLLAGTLLSIANIHMLWFYNSIPFEGNYLLQWWIGIRLLLFSVQLPCRYYIYGRLQKAVQPTNRQVIVGNLLELCHSTAWKLNEKIGLFLYFWLLVWLFLMYKKWSEFERGLVIMSTFNVAVALIFMVFSFNWLHSVMRHDGGTAVIMWDNGATLRVIEQYTRTSSYDRVSAQCKGTDECSICMSPYSADAIVRQLPCKHHYHAECIDPWLFNKRICPLCLQPIDAKPKAK